MDKIHVYTITRVSTGELLNRVVASNMQDIPLEGWGDPDDLVVQIALGELPEILAAHRYTRETEGVPCEIQGKQWTAHSDRESQATLKTSYDLAKDGIRKDTDAYKFKEGFCILTNSEMLALCMRMMAHVQRCFNIEMQVSLQIKDGKITTKAGPMDTFDGLLSQT